MISDSNDNPLVICINSKISIGFVRLQFEYFHHTNVLSCLQINYFHIFFWETRANRKKSIIEIEILEDEY